MFSSICFIIFIILFIQKNQSEQLESTTNWDFPNSELGTCPDDRINDTDKYFDLSELLTEASLVSSREENDSNSSEINTTTSPNILTTLRNFECGGENDDSNLNSSFSSSSEQSSSISYDYEEIESTCQMRRYTIQPKALNDIFNKFKRVVNNSFVQSINIEQCLSKTEPCNVGSIPPKDQKYICRQKYVEITMQVFKNSTNNTVDEQFYYPSHCVCELVKVKRKKKKKRPHHKRMQCTLEELYDFNHDKKSEK